MTMPIPKPIVLIILDGWGYREDKKANAIASANKPNWDYLLKTYPHTLISGSGKCVGLPAGQMGNSEVGHLNMGAGRIVYQDLMRINNAIENKDFFSNQTLIHMLKEAEKNKKAIHIMGLLSEGGVHSHENHIFAILAMTKNYQIPNVYLHPFLDGRDTPPKSARYSLEKLMHLCEQQGNARIVSIIGRFYAMDRDKRWERIKKAYDLIIEGKGEYQASDPISALLSAYERGETDEFVKPTAILSPIVQSGDSVIFMNFRADRARELTQALTDPMFNHFETKKITLDQFVCLSEYDAKFQLPIAFPPIRLNDLLTDCLSYAKLRQLRIAETEKYAHVTFFFNGGVEEPSPLEDRILIPSPKVPTYDKQPEMSAFLLTERLIEEIKSQKYDVIICNFANPDMLGHTGNFDATVKAIEVIDTCLGKIIETIQEVNGEAIITSDHGNAEKMFDDQTCQPHTAHTNDPIPFLHIGKRAQITKMDGKLSDIAPTLLYLLNIPKPIAMSGQSLLKLV